jgi:hypothetical protein
MGNGKKKDITKRKVSVKFDDATQKINKNDITLSEVIKSNAETRENRALKETVTKANNDKNIKQNYQYSPVKTTSGEERMGIYKEGYAGNRLGLIGTKEMPTERQEEKLFKSSSIDKTKLQADYNKALTAKVEKQKLHSKTLPPTSDKDKVKGALEYSKGETDPETGETVSWSLSSADTYIKPR